jgi:hypothetical protein
MIIENRVLRRVFGTGRVEITGIWRKVHSDEFHDFHSSSNIITIMK